MKNYLLQALISKYQYISFDIFDTLIERKVKAPSDIFAIVGKNILGDACADVFRQDRINAELIARKNCKTGEVTLDNIYDCLADKYLEKKALLKESEIQTELDFCIPKQNIIEVLKYAFEKNKTIFIISDMYLPTNVIKKMLEKCGIHNDIKVYVSNEYGVNKISGKLFRIVLNENNVNASKMLHIGDSIKADSIGALKAGIHFYHIKRRNRIGRMLHI